MGERPPFDWHRPIGPSEAQKARDAERMSQLAVEAMQRQVKAMLTDPTPATPDEAVHPEARCQRCHGPNIVWHAPSPLWNVVADYLWGILCPPCFVELYETDTGESPVWCLHPHDHDHASRQQGDAVAGVYRERARLVAALARLFPASLERSDPSPGFRFVAYVDLPTGQASWHVADSDLDLFDGIPRGQGRTWDGHDDAEKYRRVDALARGDTVAARGLYDRLIAERDASDPRGGDAKQQLYWAGVRDGLTRAAALLGIGADGAGER